MFSSELAFRLFLPYVSFKPTVSSSSPNFKSLCTTIPNFKQLPSMYNWLDGLLHFGLKTQTKKNIEWEREKSLADIDVICENMGFVHGLGIDFSAGACHF